jgi:alpha-beta hydrolase superfamily lysophospholipase/SAM-dependent methyltransferase
MTRPDGSRLTYGCWQPSEAASKTLVILDRAADDRDRSGIPPLVETLNLDDVAVFFRGGHDAGNPAAGPADARRLNAAVKDLDGWIRHLAQTHDKRVEDLLVMASGLDALLLAVWVHDYAPRIRAMVLAAPRFQISAAARAGEEPFLASREQRKMYRYTAGRIVADAAAIRVPTLLLEPARDAAAGTSPLQTFFERLQAPLKRRKVFPEAEQDLASAIGGESVRNEVRQFVSDMFRYDTARPPLLLADRYGYTHDEYERLSTPLSWRSLRGLRYRLLKAGIRALTVVSPGIRLGVRTGFDSGQMLDYAYENRARGWLPFRWIDRIFLDNIGWEACRRRKELTEKMLREAIGQVADAGQPVRIVDIAAGPGRYILEIIRALPGINISAVLRDNTPVNLEDGRQLAEQLGLTNVTFQLGDALSEQSLAEIQPAPNVAVACGIYQLIGENEMVLRSLRGLAAALRGGGYLVYTSLPWDPGLEMSARALVNRLGEPAIRRRRTQEELDDLARAAGFEKIGMEIDEFGMSTVSLARIA